MMIANIYGEFPRGQTHLLLIAILPAVSYIVFTDEEIEAESFSKLFKVILLVNDNQTRD